MYNIILKRDLNVYLRFVCFKIEFKINISRGTRNWCFPIWHYAIRIFTISRHNKIHCRHISPDTQEVKQYEKIQESVKFLLSSKKEDVCIYERDLKLYTQIQSFKLCENTLIMWKVLYRKVCIQETFSSEQFRLSCKQFSFRNSEANASEFQKLNCFRRTVLCFNNDVLPL